jgi:hypothetical protein
MLSIFKLFSIMDELLKTLDISLKSDRFSCKIAYLNMNAGGIILSLKQRKKEELYIETLNPIYCTEFLKN